MTFGERLLPINNSSVSEVHVESVKNDTRQPTGQACVVVKIKCTAAAAVRPLICGYGLS